ncbi:VanZ family protein [Agromyces sp. NPDC057865]|uniref:VanZ family protein n=1 Tax=Agromyces sp. NPDC057865 TaxID=3346267 RepID=UPI003671E6D9
MAVSARARGWAAILLAAYGLLATAVLLVPRPYDAGLIPWLRWLIALVQREGRLPGWFDYEFVEYASHTLLFLPLGILTVVAAGRRLAWLAVLAALLFGAAVEYAPLLVQRDHATSGLDLALNELGVLVGAAIGYWVLEPAPAPQRADRA